MKKWFYESSIEDTVKGNNIVALSVLILVLSLNFIDSLLVIMIIYILGHITILKYNDYGIRNLQDQLLDRYLKWTNEFLEKEI